MLYNQAGIPSQSHIRQILNLYYYSTSFPCYFINYQELPPRSSDSLSLPPDLFPLDIRDSQWIAMKKSYSPADLLITDQHVYIYHKLMNQSRFLGLFLVDITSAQPIQHTSLIHLLGVCIGSNTLMKGNYYGNEIKTISKETTKVYSVKHHSYEYEKKRFKETLLSDALSDSSLNDYIFPILGPSEIRSVKNYSIIGLSLYARTAIELGLSADMSFSISDRFILEIEKASKRQDVISIQEEAISQFRTELRLCLTDRHPIVKEVLAFIDQNIKSKISLAEYADSKHLSYGYISNLFRQQMHTSFPAYVRNIKIQGICQDLNDLSKPIGSISEDYGYTNHYQMNRDFKKVMGLTPSQYRKTATGTH